MDFLERWLYISPDGGNGASDLLIVTAVVLTFTKVVAQLVQFLSDNRADNNLIDQESVVDEEDLVSTETS
jgi:hypothetical protein